MSANRAAEPAERAPAKWRQPDRASPLPAPAARLLAALRAVREAAARALAPAQLPEIVELVVGYAVSPGMVLHCVAVGEDRGELVRGLPHYVVCAERYLVRIVDHALCGVIAAGNVQSPLFALPGRPKPALPFAVGIGGLRHDTWDELRAVVSECPFRGTVMRSPFDSGGSLVTTSGRGLTPDSVNGRPTALFRARQMPFDDLPPPNFAGGRFYATESGIYALWPRSLLMVDEEGEVVQNVRVDGAAWDTTGHSAPDTAFFSAVREKSASKCQIWLNVLECTPGGTPKRIIVRNLSTNLLIGHIVGMECVPQTHTIVLFTTREVLVYDLARRALQTANSRAPLQAAISGGIVIHDEGAVALSVKNGYSTTVVELPCLERPRCAADCQCPDAKEQRCWCGKPRDHRANSPPSPPARDYTALLCKLREELGLGGLSESSDSFDSDSEWETNSSSSESGREAHMAERAPPQQEGAREDQRADDFLRAEVPPVARAMHNVVEQVAVDRLRQAAMLAFSRTPAAPVPAPVCAQPPATGSSSPEAAGIARRAPSPALPAAPSLPAAPVSPEDAPDPPAAAAPDAPTAAPWTPRKHPRRAPAGS